MTYSPSKALVFLKEDINQSNEIKLLVALKRQRQYYYCVDGEHSYVGYFRNLKAAVQNPKAKHEFIDTNDEVFETFVLKDSEVTKDKNVKASVNLPNYTKELLNKNKFRASKYEGKWIYRIPSPMIHNLCYENCEVSNFDLINLYLVARGTYKKPSSIDFYNKIIEEIRDCADEDSDGTPKRRGINYTNNQVFFHNVGFKVNAEEIEVIKSLYECHKKSNKPVSNLAIFKNIKYKYEQMSNVIYEINRKNMKNKHSIEDCIITCSTKKNRDSGYIIDIPDYWY